MHCMRNTDIMNESCMRPAHLFAGSKLLLVVRHGQAVSNWLSDSLGPDEWFGIEETCSYTDDNKTTWGVFDAGEKNRHAAIQDHHGHPDACPDTS